MTTTTGISLLSSSAGPTTAATAAAASPSLRSSLIPSSSVVAFPYSSRPRRFVSCEVALTSSDAPSSSSSSDDTADGDSKVGARVTVKVPLKVYHVQRVGEEVELEDMVGVIKQFVAVWKGKRVSANLPYRVEFLKEVEGRSQVKFIAHLKDDEFEFI